ncbi:MAG: 5-(carboxyamino)imidazole ribonucleotide synthase [Candidatus Eremiobacteraeota bacterium]|nr:5-(carboxyamino)imidazole ribonucleotide synthase [Candidatus Eremiobacteraeota bacterium]
MIQSIGIIGGGQLGRMLALDAKRMGYHVIVLDPTPHSPCGQVADEQIVAQYDDLAAIDDLGKRTDVVTYEFENIAIESVIHLEKCGYKVTPSSEVLRITQNRLLEKAFVRQCGIPVADFAAIRTVDDIAVAATAIGFPAILKTVRGGYDGKGQWRVDDEASARAALAQANGQELIFERCIPFTKELSVICTRSAVNEIVCYPVGENMHDRGILSVTIAPARIDSRIAEQAKSIGRRIAEKLEIVGTLCVELFLTAKDELLVNEIAPRPHNSGHYTIDATLCSQYEQHVRAICSLPLSPPRLLVNAVMMNILGAGTGDRLVGVEQLLTDPSIVLHMYGKKHAVARRKMGHLTMLADSDLDRVLERAQAAHQLLRWV